MRPLKRIGAILVCCLIGHNVEEVWAANPYQDGHYYCFRCYESFVREARSDIGLYLTLYKIRGMFPAWVRRFREWLKCPECGRFRCSQPMDDEHFPF